MKSVEILKAVNIKKTFSEKKVLRGVSFSIEKGEIASIVGVSGSGKSTIFNCVAGTVIPDSGEIFINGSLKNGVQGEVGYMLQDDLLLPHMTIEENVALPLLLGGMKKKEALLKVRNFFELFGLKGTEKNYPKALSGGMRQRAALFRTAMCEREIILLDEPFSKLDKITKSSLHLWLIDMVSELSLTALFITHDMEEAVFLSDRVFVLGENGTIKAEIKIERPRSKRDNFIFSESFLEYHKKIADFFR